MTMFAMYLVPYGLMMTGLVTSIWILYLMWITIAVAKAGIGMGVMHDAIHGAHSNRKWVNNLLGQSMNLIGGNAYVWRIQHNVLHHTYTNIHEVDDDIDIPILLRMSPDQKRYWIHRYQHLYVWALYALATLFWVTSKDFIQLNKYRDRNMLKGNKEYLRRLLNIIGWKVLYYGYILVLPIYVLPVSPGQVVLMFLVMHLVAGTVLSLIFQPAHVFSDSVFVEQDEEQLQHNYMVYQFLTTTNFTLKNRFLFWLASGLNYQIEHHLFPNICHVHYEKLSPIVKKTASEFGIPYYCQEGLLNAVKGHYRFLKQLGRSRTLQAA